MHLNTHPAQGEIEPPFQCSLDLRQSPPFSRPTPKNDDTRALVVIRKLLRCMSNCLPFEYKLMKPSR